MGTSGHTGNDMVLSPAQEPYRTKHGEEDALERLQRELGPELIELALAASAAIPDRWRDWPPPRALQYLRARLRFSQDELAGEAGLTQAQVSRLEGGADARLSTWRRLYAALGFDLVLVPATRLTLPDLEKRAEEKRPPGHWRLTPARPRRVWPESGAGPVPAGGDGAALDGGAGR